MRTLIKLDAVAAKGLGRAQWPRIGEAALTIVGGYFFSLLLARLSGTALWVPATLRVTVNVIVGSLAGALFARLQGRADADAPAAAPPGADEAAVRDAKQRRAAYTWPLYRRAFWLFLAAAVLVGVFLGLRTACVVHFDPRDWVAQQRLQDRLDDADDQAQLRAAVKRNGGMPAEAAPAAAAARDDPAKLEFVDVDQEQVYLPLWYPARLAAYIHRLDQTTGDGLHYMLTREPDHLFDMLATQAAGPMIFTTILFYVLNGFIVCLAFAGLAYTFDVRSAVGGALA